MNHLSPLRQRLLSLLAILLMCACVCAPALLHAQGLRLPGVSVDSSGMQDSGIGLAPEPGTVPEAPPAPPPPPPPPPAPAPAPVPPHSAPASGPGSFSEQSSTLQNLPMHDDQPPSDALRSADYIIALVNSAPITHLELQRNIARARQFYAAHGEQLSAPQLREEALNALINDQLQMQQAKEMGIQIDDETIDQAAQNLAEQNNVSTTKMYQDLAGEGISRNQFRQQLRDHLLLMRVRQQAVDSSVHVTDQEVNAYMAAHPFNLGETVPDSINLGHILVTVPEDASPAVVAQRKAIIDAAAAALKSGRDFADVAREYSEAPEGRTGGQLGLRPVTQYPELFLEATAGKPVGTVVGPIRSSAGFHLLKVLQREKGGSGIIIQNHVRHILIAPSPGHSTQEAINLLRQLRQRILDKTATFAELAREYSSDTASAKEGGDLGWVGPDAFVPEFQAVVNELQPGEISQPVVTRFGVHLIELLGRRQIKVTQTEERQMVRNYLLEQKREEAYHNWLRQLRGQAFIQMRDQYGDV